MREPAQCRLFKKLDEYKVQAPLPEKGGKGTINV